MKETPNRPMMKNNEMSSGYRGGKRREGGGGGRDPRIGNEVLGSNERSDRRASTPVVAGWKEKEKKEKKEMTVLPHLALTRRVGNGEASS